jgi:Lipocalin-like domain
MQSMSDVSALVGSWRMTSWRKESVATGETVDALGPDPQGFITYTADGRVSVIVVPRDRKAPASLPPSDAEKVRLFDSLFAYAGTYTLDHDKVVHHLDTTWNQAWSGTDQVRFYKLAGKRLSIHGAPAPDPFTGQDVIHRVEFEKV